MRGERHRLGIQKRDIAMKIILTVNTLFYLQFYIFNLIYFRFLSSNMILIFHNL